MPQEIRGEEQPSPSPVSTSQYAPSSCNRTMAFGPHGHPFLPGHITIMSTFVRADYDLK